MMNYGYNGYNNPYLTPQQRLNQLEAQYPQFAQNSLPQQATGFKTIPVANIEEANATQTDMSGNPMFFYNKGQNEIYIKQFDIKTGAAIFQIFRHVAEPVAHENPSTGLNISEKQYKVLNDKLDALYSMLSNKVDEQPKKEVRSNAK